MSQEQKPNPDFEQRLLARLKAVVAERGAAAAATEAAEAQVASPSWRRHGPRLVLGAATAIAAVAVALIVSAGGDNPPAAFAVEPQEGGGVTIKIYSLEESPGLERALEDAGIKAQVTWLQAGKVCREPHYKPSVVHLPGGGTLGGMTMGGPGGPMTIAVGSTQRWRETFGKHRRGEVSNDEVANLNLDPKAFRPDQSVVISGTPTPYDGDPEGGSIASLGVAEGRVEPCDPVPALPSGSGGPFGLTPGGGPAYAPRGDEALSHATVAAELRRVAAIAGASDSQVEAPPGPGQFLYTKTKEVHLEAWDPDGPASGSRTQPRYFTDRQLGEGNAMPALVPTLKQVWMAPDGKTRERETLDQVEFLSAGDQLRWEEAGSPPPWAYDPREHDVGRDRSGRLVKDFASKAFRGRRESTYMSRLSGLPTEPEALRLTIENRRGGSSPVDPSPAHSPRGGATVERLLELLTEPIASPALRAAAFNALAEIPGIGFERGVADVAGRPGDAIAWTREGGYGRRYIFDPHTSKILAQAEVVFNAEAAEIPQVPDGTVFRETAYLRSGIVDSIHERPDERNG
ncbi:MAG TPA: hypothetical protein VNO20_04570 [Solirubrobacterales bacterium]|nr:hypothetical protein [Solirubrobacterales bacterium]